MIDGSFPTTQCDKAATLDLVPKPTVNREQSDAAKDAVLDSASLWPLYRAIAGPGTDVDLSGPYTVRQEDGRYAVTGGGLTIPLDAVKGAGGDRRGKPPTSVYFHTGSIAGSGSTGAGDAWGEVFPCGPGNLALTVCTNGEPVLRDGTYGTVAAIFDEPVPLAGDQDVDYTFDVAGKQYRLRYDADADGIEGWTLTGGDLRARAMIRNNVVMLLVPLDSPATTYQISTSVNGRRDNQPRDPAPLRGTITVAAVPGVETPQQFLDALSAAITNRDGAFLVNRLHPAVITSVRQGRVRHVHVERAHARAVPRHRREAAAPLRVDDRRPDDECARHERGRRASDRGGAAQGRVDPHHVRRPPLAWFTD